MKRSASNAITQASPLWRKAAASAFAFALVLGLSPSALASDETFTSNIADQEPIAITTQGWETSEEPLASSALDEILLAQADNGSDGPTESGTENPADNQDLASQEVAQQAEVAIPQAIESLVYDSTAQAGVLEGDGYTLEGATATNAGTYTAIATLIDTDTTIWSDGTTEPKQIAFRIAPASIEGATVTLKTTKYTYSGAACKPIVTKVTLSNGKAVAADGYTVTYANNKNAGTATVTVAGINNYSGAAKALFTISKRSFAKAKVSKIATKTYSGKALKPSPVVKWGKTKLKKGIDYKVTYKSNKKAGTAKVIVTGMGNYTAAKKTVSFKIVKRKLSSTKIKLSFTSTGWTGGKKKPAVTVKVGSTKLKKGTDYSVTYRNNVAPGKAEVVIKGKGSLTGSVTKTFTITKGGTVYLTRTGECYHRGWCGSLSRSKIASTLYDARRRGYRPCHNCNP